MVNTSTDSGIWQSYFCSSDDHVVDVVAEVAVLLLGQDGRVGGHAAGEAALEALVQLFQVRRIDEQLHDPLSAASTCPQCSRGPYAYRALFGGQSSPAKRFPLAERHLELRMRDQQVPDNGLEGLGVGRDGLRVDGRDHDAGVGDLRGVAAVATDHPATRAPTVLACSSARTRLR